ncbi:MAG: PrsW family glutamic-type intramembrane protease [Candidatus Gracilibacteria bacterium]|nr:PrsW family glutamic-type intramembrane protease [Candidatus Gracilibacteria bacterium]
MEILSLIPIIIITFFPILMWGYIFSYLDNSPLGARRFGLGIVAGAISVVPVLFMSDMMAFADLVHWNVFPLLAIRGNEIELAASLLMTIGIIAISVFVFSLGFFSLSIGKVWKTLIRNTGILFLIGILFSFFHFLLFSLDIFEAPLANGGITIAGVVFGTLKLVLFYYVVIAIIEETSKHFCVLTSSLPFIDSVKKGVLFSIFIALGFGFIENILYLKNIAEQSGVWSSGVLSTWIFRSIFSLLTHIICSVIVGLYFSRAFIAYTSLPKILPYAKTLLYGFLLSILVHAIFDISLTVGFTGIIFIYFFGSYLSITRIFYEEQ